jgi:hypothetical protein
VLVSILPFDEDIQAHVPPAHQKENMVSYNPLENFDDTLFHDFISKEVPEEPLDAIDPLCNNVIDNIDDFIHVEGMHGMLIVLVLMGTTSTTSRAPFK